MSKRSAFSVIELLVVISIVALLISILLPALSNARIRARYARWQGYSHNLRADPDMVAYWNMEQQDASHDRVWNRAAGNALQQAKSDLEPVDFDAAFHLSPSTSHGAFIANDMVDPNPSDRWAEGRWKGKFATSFNGIQQYMRVRHDDVLNFEGHPEHHFTISASIFPVNVSLWDSVVSKAIRNRNSYGFLINTGPGPDEARINLFTNVAQNVNSTNSFQQNEWNQVAFRYDGEQYRMFINGKPDPTVLAATNQVFTNQDAVTIGVDPYGAPEWLEGRMDELAMFQRALSDDEILQMHRIGAVRTRD